MRLSFLPGELFLEGTPGGYTVTLRGQVILATSSAKRALAKYHELRVGLEEAHPSPEPSTEERQKLLHRHIGESLVDDNHYRPQQEKGKRKNTSRTFG